MPSARFNPTPASVTIQPFLDDEAIETSGDPFRARGDHSRPNGPRPDRAQVVQVSSRRWPFGTYPNETARRGADGYGALLSMNVDQGGTMDRSKLSLLALARTAVLVMAAFTLVVAVRVLGETNRPVPSGRVLLVQSADPGAGALPP